MSSRGELCDPRNLGVRAPFDSEIPRPPRLPRDDMRKRSEGVVTDLKSLIRRRRITDMLFGVLGFISIAIGLITLGALIWDLLRDGLPQLSWQFFTSFPSRRAAQAGILSAWVGTTLIMIVTMLTSLPLGVAAGIYLEEYAPK